MRTLWLASMLILAVACGKKEQPTPPPADTKKQQPAQPVKKADPEPAEPKTPSPDRQAEREKLEIGKEEAAVSVKALKDALAKLEKKHAEESVGMVSPRDLRPYLMGLMRDSNTETARLESMEKKLGGLEKKVAATSATGELRVLQDKMQKTEDRYWKAHSGWMASMAGARHQAAAESPVKRDIDMLRAVRGEWLKATPSARRGPVPSNEKSIINNGFRAWIGELPERKRVVSEILKQPNGAGSGPDSFDFTDLDFYLLISLRELQLEKLNIVEEKKERSEDAVVVEAIEKEMDALREQIAEKLTQGGGDLEQYQDISSRIQEQRTKAADLQRQVEEYQAVFADVEATKTRHMEELDVASRKLDEAEAALRKATDALRRFR